MPYTTEEGGRLNNFAAEKRNYIILGVGAVLLIVGVLTVAVYASSNVGVS